MTRVALLGLVVASRALAFSLATDSQGDVVRWKDRVDFVVDERFVAELRQGSEAWRAIEASIAAYDAAAAGVSVTVKAARQPRQVGYAVGAGAENENLITALEDWPFAQDALATTLVTVSAKSNVILDADILFNVERYRFEVVKERRGDERVYDVQNTLMHELGHALGLLHNEEDSTVVMYPGAEPWEVAKRALAPDDEAGLEALYAVDASGQRVPVVGCAAAPGAPGTPWAVAIAALLGALGLGRTPRVAEARARSRGVALALACALVPTAASAGETESQAAPVAPGATAARAPTADARPNAAAEGPARADEGSIAWGEVVATASRWLPGHRLIVTDVEVEVRGCVRGTCPGGRVTLQLLGGRVGDIEQLVLHQPAPSNGALVALTQTNGRLRLSAVMASKR